MARGERPRTGEGTEVHRHPGGVVKSNDIKYLTERAAISSETTRACATRASIRGRSCFPITICLFPPGVSSRRERRSYDDPPPIVARFIRRFACLRVKSYALS